MFESTTATLQEPDFHTRYSGSQLCVSRYGQKVLNLAIGMRHDSRPMSAKTRIMWACCAKPVTTIALYQILQEQSIPADTAVCEIIPEFGSNGKQNVTLAHVLTHTVPYSSMGMTWCNGSFQDHGEKKVFRGSWDEALKAVCDEPLVGEPGSMVVYLALANWLLLAEIIQRLERRRYEEVIADRVLEPLEMYSTIGQIDFAAMTKADCSTLVAFNDNGDRESVSFDLPEFSNARWPGFNSRGPASDLVRLAECLAGWRSAELISHEWRTRAINPRRTGLPDPIFMGARTSWGMGICSDPIPFGLGPEIRVVGQTGVRSSMLFADINSGISIAFISSGLIANMKDWARKRKVIRSVYRDLNIPMT